MDPLRALIIALASPLEEVDALAREQEDGSPGYSPLFNPPKTPLWALPWLAQVAGVRWDGPPSETLRQLIIDRPSAKRGTPAAIIAATKSTLTGTKSVQLEERTGGSVWTFSVFTNPAETPSPVLTRRAIASETPAGMIFTHNGVTELPIIDAGTRTIDSATATFDTATLADIT